MTNYGYTGHQNRTGYKRKILERDNYTCQLCGEYGDQVDHVIPYAVSRDSTESNLRALCRQCNTDTRRPRKDAALPFDEWSAWLESELARA